MTKKGDIPYVENSLPGPPSRGTKLPDPLPAGVLPHEDSRLWMFVPKAVQQGEAFIQDDTRDWFEERDRKVVICRAYPDHPRWILVSTLRSKILNDSIVSEVHMLARLHGGRPEYPSWVPARLSVKQHQSDISFRLTKLARQVLVSEGDQAMRTFAQKSPGQFLKFVADTFVPKKVEQTVTASGGSLDTETADALLEALAAEVKRREEEALVARNSPLDYEAPAKIVDMVEATANVFHQATEPKRKLGATAALMKHGRSARTINIVKDLEADFPAEVKTEWEWD